MSSNSSGRMARIARLAMRLDLALVPAPVRLGVAPRRGRAAACGQVFAVAVSNGGVQSAASARGLGNPSEHRAEILARNMNQGGARPHAIVRCAGTLRVGQVIVQWIQ